jgi:hypothetical protein
MADPARWPDWPLLAIRAVVEGEIVRGVLVADGGYNVYRATVKEAKAACSAADVGLTWAEALTKHFRMIRYASPDAFFSAGWRVDTDR